MSVPRKEGKFGINYEFETEDGGQIILPSSGHLHFVMGNFNPGDFCRITFMGKEVMKKGKFAGKMGNSFSGAIDRTKKRNPAAPAPAPVGGPAAESVASEPDCF